VAGDAERKAVVIDHLLAALATARAAPSRTAAAVPDSTVMFGAVEMPPTTANFTDGYRRA
jgi:hypothetical protein